MEVSIGKDAPYHMSLSSCKLKEWDTPTYILEWIKSTRATASSASEAGEQEELFLIAGGNTKW